MNGQLFGAYIYDSSIGAWRAQGSTNNVGTQLAQLQTASPVAVASAAARNALYPTPIQGQSVFRTDLGYQETYYGLYNSSTNPGGRATAGWYGNQRNIGLVPIVPPTVSVSGGTATANSLGLITFSAATSISLNGAFTDAYKKYRVIVEVNSASSSGILAWRYRNAGTDNSSTVYGQGGLISRTSGATANLSSGNTTYQIMGSLLAASGYSFIWVIDVVGVRQANNKAMTWLTYYSDTTSGSGGFAGGYFTPTTTFDGFTLFPTGNMSGNVQVFGYNE